MNLQLPSGHPCLFTSPDKKFSMLPTAAKTEFGKELAERIIYDAELLLQYAPEKRVVIGFRLLAVSRNVLYRMTTLTLAWLLTERREFADRAILEMCNAADFVDWNAEEHFLDTAEMSLALSIGYDWMYDLLTDEQRKLISSAIIEKALKPSFTVKKNWWIKCRMNWNQVCHAGLTAGALAVADLEPELAQRIIERALECVPNSITASYYPNGAYSEGPAYWGYGTNYAIVLMALLHGAFGQDFGLSDMPGFSKNGDFITAAFAPDGNYYTYSDCGSTSDKAVYFTGFLPLIWLDHHFDRPDLFSRHVRKSWKAVMKIREKDLQAPKDEYYRLNPLSMLYLRDVPEVDKELESPFYSGDEADVPLVFYRAGRKDSDAFLGAKGGSPLDYHGHMDAGSFVYVAGRVRWVCDLGGENYHHIESAGLNLWNYEQDNDRWKVFRLGASGHSVLRIDKKPLLINGRATFTEVTKNHARLDMTSLYQGDAEKVTRTFEFNGNDSLVITDVLEGVRPGAAVNWQIITMRKAEVSGKTVTLSKGKKSLTIRKNTGKRWRVTPAEKLMQKYDSPNPGVSVVSFDTIVPEDGKVEIIVEMSLQKKQK